MAGRYQEPVFTPSALDRRGTVATTAAAWTPHPRLDGRFEVARVIDPARASGATLEFSRTPAGAIRSFPSESLAQSVCRLLNGEYQ